MLGGCGNQPPPSPGSPATASADEVPFVVFREGTLVIDGVGATVRVPAAVGSTVSPQTILSSDSSVVEVTAAGELRARSPGRASIRATGNPAQVLEVEVRDARAANLRPVAPSPATAPEPSGPLSLLPASADLRLGQVLLFEVAVGGQKAQPQWRFDGPALLQQSAPGGFVATRVGKTRVCASAAQQSICAVVVVSR
jgi:hypothetical protein